MMDLMLEEMQEQAIAPFDLNTGGAMDRDVGFEVVGCEGVADRDQSVIHDPLRRQQPGRRRAGQVIGERGVRIVPDVSVTSGATGSGLIDALLGTTLKDRVAPTAGVPAGA